MVVIDKWSLKQGFPESDRFFEALLNSYERCGTDAFDLRNDKLTIHVNQAVASCDSFLANLRAVVAVLTVNMGTKQCLSLLLVAKDRENPVVGAKNAGRWLR